MPAKKPAREAKTSRKKAVVRGKTKSKELNLQRYLDEVKNRAYEIFLEQGSTHGNDLNDWFQAEKEIKKKYKIS